MKRLLTILGCFLSVSVMALENSSKCNHEDNAQLLGAPCKEHASNQHFSCDLRQTIGQCRDYEILDNAQITMEEIRDGCQSMSGLFSSQSCAQNNRVSICSDIIRNYHQPDVIYSNSYYENSQGDWTLEKTQRVCYDLGGELLR